MAGSGTAAGWLDADLPATMAQAFAYWMEDDKLFQSPSFCTHSILLGYSVREIPSLREVVPGIHTLTKCMPNQHRVYCCCGMFVDCF